MAQTGDFGGAGNRTQVFDGSAWKTYTPDVLNQYTTAEGVSVTNGPEHQITTFDGITSTYFNDGRLSSVYSPSADTWTNFYYDALGRCVKRVKDTWAYTYSYYDGEKELLECGSGGGANYRNVYGKGIDEILVRKDNINNWTYYFQQDQNGNVTHLTWGDGTVVETFQYDAFGLLNKTESGWKNPFLFTGRRYQSIFGIYEYRARAYHPRLGRFTSEDPKLYDAGDYNLFRYCHNDPVDKVDPLGLLEFVFDSSFPKDAQTRFMEAVKLGSSTSERGRYLANLPGVVSVFPTDAKNPTSANKEKMQLFLNPKDPAYLDPKSRRDFQEFRTELPPSDAKGRAVTVFHEFGHFTGAKDEKYRGHNVRDNENPVRRGLKLDDRESYGGVPIKQ